MVSPEPVSQPVRVSALVWELDGSLSVAASPVLPVADERMVADVGQVVDEPQVAMAANARQARALLASAQVQPGEPEWRQGVQALEPVVDDLAVVPGCSVPGRLDEHCREPVVAEPRRGQELPGRRVCSQRWVELPQTRPVCRDWRMRTVGDSVLPLAGAEPAWPWEECAVRAWRRLLWAAAGE